jgi:hypothetical protein
MSIAELETKYCDMIVAMIRNKKNGTIKRFTRTPIETAMLKDKLTAKQKNELYKLIASKVPEDIDAKEWNKVVIKMILNTGSTKRSGGKTQKKQKQ